VKDSDSLESLRAVNDFSELTRVGDGITQRMLTQQLREMKSNGIVHGKVDAEVLPR
jgi:DNA-binding HxlR family transcriptional regulator